MKKLVSLFVLSVFTLGLFVGCGNQAGNEKNSAENKNIRIGIIQIVEHPALDAARKGFLETLASNGYVEGKNLTVDYENAQGDQSNLKTIAQKLVNNKADLILAIATPAAIAAASETKDIPILITAVTDPVAAKLVKSLEKPETNVSGTTDMTPIAEQFDLLKKLVPSSKNIGIVYNSSEVNSQIQVEIAKKVASGLGLNIIEATVTNSSEVMQATQSLVGKVNAIYIPTDNVVASSITSVVSVANKNKIPVIAGESGMVKNGSLATIGIDYFKLGKQTGEMATKILKGSKPNTMAIEQLKDVDIVVNQKTATTIGLEVPKDILDKAKEIIK
jgi:putative ABC transport system substrate-binding protein